MSNKLRFWRYLMLFLATVSTTACAINHKIGTQSASTSPYFIEYYLPERSFKIDAIYQLRECDVDNESMRIKIGAEISPLISANHDLPLTFSPDAVSQSNKSAAQNIALELHPNGTLKSINGTSEEKTGSILGNAFKFASNLLGLAFNIALDRSELVQDSKAKAILCNLETQTHLYQVKLIKKESMS